MSQALPKARHRARELLIQALYQWHLSGTPATEIERQFYEYTNLNSVDVGYFKKTLYAITDDVASIDAVFSPFLDRPQVELNPVELATLRLASFELQQQLDIPYKVVLNEALLLCKTFGSDAGYKYINAVLDPVAKQWRAAEVTINDSE